MAVLFVMMRAIRRHYDRVAQELRRRGARRHVLPPACTPSCWSPSCTSRPCARWPTRSLAGPHPGGAHGQVDPPDTKALQGGVGARGIPVPLKVLDSPYREITRPVLEYVKSLRRDSPRDVVSVYIPEYVVGHWYEHLLHNQSALRLKGRLLFTPGVMVTSVPWQLESSEAAQEARLRRPATFDRRTRRRCTVGFRREPRMPPKPARSHFVSRNTPPRSSGKSGSRGGAGRQGRAGRPTALVEQARPAVRHRPGGLHGADRAAGPRRGEADRAARRRAAAHPA